jgi:hypothetical protein
MAAASSAVPAAFAANLSFAWARACSGFTDGPLTVAREEDFAGFGAGDCALAFCFAGELSPAVGLDAVFLELVAEGVLRVGMHHR